MAERLTGPRRHDVGVACFYVPRLHLGAQKALKRSELIKPGPPTQSFGVVLVLSHPKKPDGGRFSRRVHRAS